MHCTYINKTIDLHLVSGTRHAIYKRRTIYAIHVHVCKFTVQVNYFTLASFPTSASNVLVANRVTLVFRTCRNTSELLKEKNGLNPFWKFGTI